MPANIFVLLFVAVINITLAFLVLVRNTKSGVNISFFIFVGALSFWSISVGMLLAQKNMFWSDLALFSGNLIGISFILFAKYFPEGNPVSKKFTFSFFILPAILFIVLSPFRLFVSGIVIEGEQITPVIGPLYPLLMLWMVVSPLIGIFILFRKYKKTVKERAKKQLQYLFWGFAIFLTAVTVSNVLLPAFGIGTIAFFGPVFTLILVGFLSYAIVKHKLMDIRLIVTRAITYALLIFVMAGLFGFGLFTFASLISPNLFSSSSNNQFIITTLLATILAFTFQPLRRVIEKITDKIFFRDSYNPRELINDISHIMAFTLRLEEISHKTLEELLKQMRITRGAYVLTDKNKIFNIAHKGYKRAPEVHDMDVLKLTSQSKMLVFEEMEEGDMKDIMRKLDITVVLPLRTKGSEIGMLVLGEKQSGELYTDQDLSVLEILSKEAALAIHNAQSYEKIKRFNITLQEEVEKATVNLEKANKELKEADELKDEFVYVASHELRTPMTAIKNYLWLALNKQNEGMDPKLYKNLNRAYISTERLIKLVQNMLTVSRIEGKRLVLNYERIDILELYQEIFDEMKIIAEKEGVTMVLVPTKEKVFIEADKTRIGEVLTNLVSNALKFTPRDGSVTVSIEVSNNMVITRVSDTGYGIPKEDLSRLFKKFGRLGHSYKKVAESAGTGLGLFITKQIIEAHKGTITLESEVDKGSTFTFSLPQSETKSAIGQVSQQEVKKEVNSKTNGMDYSAQ